MKIPFATVATKVSWGGSSEVAALLLFTTDLGALGLPGWRRMNQFRWTPGIGDPTIGGWVTVALYLIATILCWITARRIAQHYPERRVWFFLSLLFLCLGINKQLDLQSALTELGRVIAFHQHWYDQRQTVQVIFILVVAIAGTGMILSLLFLARRSPMPTLLALAGTTLVIAYVLIRAASFHHIDHFIGETVLGFRWNWVIEMGGISVVIVASWWRLDDGLNNGPRRWG